VKYKIATISRVGGRTNNQDAFGYRETENGILMVVADGLGGVPRGELASQVVVESVCGNFINHRAPIKNPKAFLIDLVEQAHRQVVDAGFRENPPVRPCTTIIVCLVQGHSAWWVHVGDSRLYLIRDGKAVFRTRDHSPVEDLYRQGVITSDEIRFHPKRNYIARCLGGVVECPKVEFGFQTQLRKNDVLLLCSDGLWSQLDEKYIVHQVSGQTMDEALAMLGRAAEESGGAKSDNITAVVMRWLERKHPSSHTAGSSVLLPEDKDLEDAIDLINDAIAQFKDEMKGK